MKAPIELWTVARSLGDIVDEVVFVGGMIRELIISDPAAGPARPTQDVDCIVNPQSRPDYIRFTDRLRARGFSECTDEGAPICRWIVDGVRVDVMPVDPSILGFSNVWYPSGLEHAVHVDGPDCAIRITDAVHFCATKIEAFLERGDDFYHHDMEDIIAVVDGRPELFTELERAPADVRDFIAATMREWLNDARFLEALPGQLAGDSASQARHPMLLARLRQIAALASKPASDQAAAAPARVAAALVPSLPARPGPRVPIPAALPPSGPIALPTWTGGGLSVPSLPGSVTLRSSNLRAASYDARTQTLTIEFYRGRTYVYTGVSENVYAGLIRAASHGRYFNQWIRGRYVYRRVK